VRRVFPAREGAHALVAEFFRCTQNPRALRTFFQAHEGAHLLFAEFSRRTNTRTSNSKRAPAPLGILVAKIIERQIRAEFFRRTSFDGWKTPCETWRTLRRPSLRRKRVEIDSGDPRFEKFERRVPRAPRVLRREASKF
jgi:hypothetical protein